MKRIPGHNVVWSPDSTEVAFNASGDDLYAVRVRGSEPPKLIAADGDRPAWSPAGPRIAFMRTTTTPYPCRQELFVVPSGGGEPRRLVGC